MAGLANLSEFFENPLFTETIREVPVETGYIGSRFLPSENTYDIKERISKFLDEELQLALNKKTCIRPVSMGIQFVGLHIWSTHRTVRKSTSLRIKRRLKAAAKQYVAGNLTYERYNSTLQSYMGMMKHNDCYRFKMQLLEDVEMIINESGVAA